MLPNPDLEASEPLVEVFDNLAPPHLHAAAWATCMGKGWYFGHGSVEGGSARFWRLDLDGDAAFEAIWEHSRARCEALAGGPLRVVSQYANGHTYGLGGNPHLDDSNPGAYTLLYYPNPEWADGWDGETVFFDDAGEIALSVRLRPNRAVFFDARIPHSGRAPSRICGALRVSVAFKLQRTGAHPRSISRCASAPVPAAVPPAPATYQPGHDTPVPVPPATDSAAVAGEPSPAAVQPAPATGQPGRDTPVPAPPATDSAAVAGEPSPAAVQPAPVTLHAHEFAPVEEIGRDGARRTYRGRIEEGVIAKSFEEHLQNLGSNVRLPGFRPGRVPRAVLEERYGEQARAEVLRRLAADLVRRGLPAGSIASSCELIAGEKSGAMEVCIHATHLPDLPAPDLSEASFERLVALDPTPEQAAFLRSHLKQQALNFLDSTYSVPLFPGIVENEFQALWKAAQSQGAVVPTDSGERDAIEARLRGIAERRLRLGLIVAELARRFGIGAPSGAELEDRAIECLIAQAAVTERRVSSGELLAMMKS